MPASLLFGGVAQLEVQGGCELSLEPAKIVHRAGIMWVPIGITIGVAGLLYLFSKRKHTGIPTPSHGGGTEVVPVPPPPPAPATNGEGIAPSQPMPQPPSQPMPQPPAGYVRWKGAVDRQMIDLATAALTKPMGSWIPFIHQETKRPMGVLVEPHGGGKKGGSIFVLEVH